MYYRNQIGFFGGGAGFKKQSHTTVTDLTEMCEVGYDITFYNLFVVVIKFQRRNIMYWKGAVVIYNSCPVLERIRTKWHRCAVYNFCLITL